MKQLETAPPKTPVGRGASTNPANRFDPQSSEAFDDGWDLEEEDLPPLRTEVRPEIARSIISRNKSPDLNFEQSINPYQGCEHGCIYCYARPSHAYLDLSPGLDFETKLFFKQNAVELLEAELARRSYRPSTIVLGANTDPYQPIEKNLTVTRRVLEVLERCHHPVGIVTKGSLVTRDADILASMAKRNLVSVILSVTTLDNRLKRILEPRTSSPKARLKAIQTLRSAGVPTGVLVAPIIPRVNDAELEAVLAACREAGAISARYTLIRLPHEIKQLFKDWLHEHMPERAEHVMSLIRQSRGGRDNDARFGYRQRGTGVYADLIAQRFATAVRQLGYEPAMPELDVSQFVAPGPARDQLALF